MGWEGREMVTKGSVVSQTHLHAGVDHGHKYYQGQQHKTGQVETQHEYGAGRREEVGNYGCTGLKGVMSRGQGGGFPGAWLSKEAAGSPCSQLWRAGALTDQAKEAEVAPFALHPPPRLF